MKLQNVKLFRFIILEDAESKSFFFSHISQVTEGNRGNIFFALLQVLSLRQKSSFKKSRKRLGFSTRDGIFGYRNIISKDICGYVQTRIKPRIN